jgi:tripartite-type tricarboxylate transporter receptor subunit TctC
MLARRPYIALAALIALMGSASAGEWPDRPVKIIYPYGAGSTGDVTARLIAHELSEKFGQPFIVENRVGANGTIATEAVAHSAPDGSTLLWAITPQIAISPAMTKVRYDPVKDLVPISAVSINRFALIVNAKVPVKSVAEQRDECKLQGQPTGADRRRRRPSPGNVRSVRRCPVADGRRRDPNDRGIDGATRFACAHRAEHRRVGLSRI